jgi:glycosyltransferase involved in cell wall biosynthesis
MIKVLHIVNRFNLGGHIFKPVFLAKYLPKEYETLVIGGIHTEEEESGEFVLINEGVDYILIPEMSRSINFLSDFKAFFKILKIIRTYQPDIVHTHASKAGLIGRLAAFISRTPVIVHTFHGHVFHSYFGGFKTSIFKLIEKSLSSISTAIVAVSHEQKKDLCDTYKVAKSKKTYMIPIGLDLSKFRTDLNKKRSILREQYEIEDKDIIIAIVGRIVPIKNHKLFIESIKALKTLTNKSVKALIVGDGNLKEDLVELCKSLELKTNFEVSYAASDIIFTSWIKDVDLVYAAADIVTLSSFNEGTPVALIEAQVAQKPIVTTDAGGTKDILYKDNFHRIAKSNVKDFAKHLSEIISLLDSPETISPKAQEETLKEFSHQTMVDRIDDLYKRLLKKL